MRAFVTSVLAGALLLAGSAVAAPSLKVASAVVCAVDDEECTTTEPRFGEEVAVLRFVTVVEGATGEAWVEHVWKREGREVFRLKLALKTKRYRTVSKKTVAGLPGAWTASVVDPVGRELASVSFRVEGPDTTSAPIAH